MTSRCLTERASSRRALARAIEDPDALTVDEIAELIGCDESDFSEALFSAARDAMGECGKTAVLPRGLIEVSNICAKDCLYCGIRRSSGGVSRYCLDAATVRSCCDEAVRRGFTAVAFQSGEIESEANTSFYEERLRELERGGILREVTLSLGEQTEAVYRRWKAAAGDMTLRYLLRIETSNRELYAKIHPATCSFDRRLACLRSLKALGYVTGSGVMIGLPGQTVRELAEDIAFFRRERLDMVGMGPYVPHGATPLGKRAIADGFETAGHRQSTFRLALRMIAVTRLVMRSINIVAATALETFDPRGREMGLSAGANVIMPNLTPDTEKAAYSLYPGKATAD